MPRPCGTPASSRRWGPRALVPPLPCVTRGGTRVVPCTPAAQPHVVPFGHTARVTRRAVAEPCEGPGRHPGFWEWVVPWRQAGLVQEEDVGAWGPPCPRLVSPGRAQPLHCMWAPATVGTGGQGFRCIWDPGDCSVAEWRVGAAPACYSQVHSRPGSTPAVHVLSLGLHVLLLKLHQSHQGGCARESRHQDCERRG